MNKYWLLLIVPLLLLLWWGVGRGNSAPVTHFAPVQTATLASTVSTNGKVEPAHWAAARAESAGVVQLVEVQRGQDVRAGQVLVKLDVAAAQSALAAALAQEQQARADLATVGQGGKASQQALVQDQLRTAETAVTVAQRNYDSLKRLEQQQAATKLQVQDAKDGLDRAQLQLRAAGDQQHALVTAGDRQVAEARLHNAQAAVALARHQVAQDEILAPTSGTVYQFDLKVGAYLQPGDLVALIGSLEEMKVTVYVDEPDLGRVGVGLPVEITWDAKPGEKWWGKIDRMPTQVIALGSRAVGEVSTIVSNPGHNLLPGVSVNALIVSKVVRDTLSMPKAALRTLRGADGVYVLGDHDAIRWTPVATGVSDVNDVQILSGLKIGDKVLDRVVDPSDAEIRNGMRVKPVFN